MKANPKWLIPVAAALVVVAAVIAYNNHASAPRSGEVDPLPATGNVEDAAAVLIQGAAAEDSIMAESDSDLDIIQSDGSDAGEVEGAYGEDGF